LPEVSSLDNLVLKWLELDAIALNTSYHAVLRSLPPWKGLTLEFYRSLPEMRRMVANFKHFGGCSIIFRFEQLIHRYRANLRSISSIFNLPPLGDSHCDLHRYNLSTMPQWMRSHVNWDMQRKETMMRILQSLDIADRICWFRLALLYYENGCEICIPN